MREDSIPFKQVYIVPDSISYSDVALSISDLNQWGNYDAHNHCLEYRAKGYHVYHFIESNNSYIIKEGYYEISYPLNGIFLNDWSIYIDRIIQNKDLKDTEDIISFLNTFYNYSSIIWLDTDDACILPFLQIDHLPLDTQTVHFENLMIMNCDEHQRKIMEIHNGFKDRIKAVFITVLPKPDLDIRFDTDVPIHYILSSGDKFELITLSFSRRCFGKYYYRPLLH